MAPDQAIYGLKGAESEPLSDAASAIISAADKADARPLWISVWGGANALAQALMQVQKERTQEQVDAFVSKLRVYSISDQDDAGPWIRKAFPKLVYVVKPSTPDAAEYSSATWTGISGDEFYRNGAGADTSLITNEWLDAHPE